MIKLQAQRGGGRRGGEAAGESIYDVRTGGGVGQEISQICGQAVHKYADRGGGGQKIHNNCKTSYMEDPQCESEERGRATTSRLPTKGRKCVHGAPEKCSRLDKVRNILVWDPRLGQGSSMLCPINGWTS